MSQKIDVYASVNMDTWNEHKETILAFSLDGITILIMNIE